MEDLTKGDELREFCRTFQIGSTAYIVQRQENNHRRFMDLSKYGGERRCIFIIVPEGQEGSGWVTCISQMRWVVKHFEQKGVFGSRNGEVSCFNMCLMPQTVEHQRQSYLCWNGKGIFRIEYSSRNIMRTYEEHKLKAMEGFVRKEEN